MEVLPGITRKKVTKVTNHIANEYEIFGKKSRTNFSIIELLYSAQGRDAVNSMINFTAVALIKMSDSCK